MNVGRKVAVLNDHSRKDPFTKEDTRQITTSISRYFQTGALLSRLVNYLTSAI